jgi:hypothetical protein
LTLPFDVAINEDELACDDPADETAAVAMACELPADETAADVPTSNCIVRKLNLVAILDVGSSGLLSIIGSQSFLFLEKQIQS